MTLRKDYLHGTYLKIVVTNVYFEDGDTYFEGDVIESNDTMFKAFGKYTIVMDENVSVLEV